MHENQRRLVCRVGFLLFCVLPTVLVITWICWPDGTAKWRVELTQALGIDVSVARVSRPRPGITLFQNVHLVDAEVGEVGQVAYVEMAETDLGIVLLASQAELRGDRLPRVWEVVHDRLLRNWRNGDSVVTLRASRLTLSGQSADHAADETLVDVVLQFEQHEVGPRLVLNFRRADAPLAEPAQVIIQREQNRGEMLSTSWAIDTRETFISCRTVARVIPAFSQLGDDCEFSGVAWGQQTATGWQGDVSGRFRNVDLYRLVNEQFPHTLSGLADVQLQRATFRDGRIVDIAGSLRSDGGVIGVSLIDAARKSLKLMSGERVGASAVPYGRLDLSFNVENDRLELRGNIDNQGAILSDSTGRPLLFESPEPMVPVLAVVRTLVPQSDVQVPLTRETARLLSVFPVPAVVRSAASDELPASTLRLEPATEATSFERD